MTLKEAKEEIINRSVELLEKDASGRKYVCPSCKVGISEDEKGLITNDSKHFTCPLGCFKDFDIFNILAMSVGTTNEENLIRVAASELNIDVEDKVEEVKKPSENKETKNKNRETDYTLLYKESAARMYCCKFLQEKKISKQLQSKFGIGYCEDWIHPSTSEDMKKYITPTNRIIIPLTKKCYTAIYTGNNNNIAKVQRVGEDTIFNRKSLYMGTKPLFVMENELDALSIMECGYDAVAFGSLAHIDALMKLLGNKKSLRLLIYSIYPNNGDEDVKQEILNIENKMRELKIQSIFYDISKGKSKSINDILCEDKEKLKKNIKEALDKAREFELENVKKYQQDNNNIKYLEEIKKSKGLDYVSTGFKQLDEVLDGGIYEGLYTICGESTIGKTSFALQLADNIAAQNTDVLYFSLDTSRKELIAKSLSRMTAYMSVDNKKQLTEALSLREILNYSDDNKEIIDAAIEKYKNYANSMRMYECNNISVLDIRNNIREYIENTQTAGRKIVAIVDSINEIFDYDDKTRTDETLIKMSIVELKRISRDYNMPIIIISRHVKDSIEEVSNVILSLKSSLSSSEVKLSELKKSPRMLFISIEKNRNGKTGDIMKFRYFPEYNIFQCYGLYEEKEKSIIKINDNVSRSEKKEEIVDKEIKEETIEESNDNKDNNNDSNNLMSLKKIERAAKHRKHKR